MTPEQLPRDVFLPAIELDRCLRRTLYEQLDARLRARPVSGPNLRRLFMRRWRAALQAGGLDAVRTDELFRAGCEIWERINR